MSLQDKAGHGGPRACGLWRYTVKDGEGNVKSIDESPVENLVVNQGLNSLLGSTLAGWTQITTWYILVTSGHPTPAAADTGSSHAGWVEFTGYVSTTRPAWLRGSVSGQSVSNTSSKASFAINAAASIGGAALIGINSKGTFGGSLYAVGSASLKTLSSGDTLEIEATFTMTAG
jgi:hypothetical protein